MALTLLLDLDDTLLDTNVAEFVPAYFQALARHLSSWVKPDLMMSALMAGTQSMLSNENPALTLEQVFDLDFYPKLGMTKQELHDIIDDFYDNVFRSLGSVTRQRAGAVDLVDWAQENGHRVVVATDPLFPRKAVFERIRWAGLDPARFELISSYETFHFTKSHSAYYAELLGRLGWPEGPVLMVGNDVDRDLRCAQELGLATYQVDGPSSAASAEPADRIVGRGTLVDLRQWLQSSDPALMEPSLGGRPATTAILRSTPAVLQGITGGLQASDWKREPTPDDWAVIEIMCHLRDTELEVHRAQIETLRRDQQPFVPRPDASVWAKQRNYLNEDGPRAVEQFIAARMENLAHVMAATSEEWAKPARHAIFGPTSFGEVVGFMADHDRLHIQQAWQTLRAEG
jgi:FMN phosphatase YigB (HAD superfamily)